MRHLIHAALPRAAGHATARAVMIALALASTMLATPASAVDHGFYLGAGVTQARIDDIGKDFTLGSVNDFRLRNTAWKAFAGFRALDALAFEIDYADLGHDRRNFGNALSFTADAKAISGFVVGLVPIAMFDLYGKAGVAHWRTDATASGLGGFRIRDDGNEFAWGAGAQVRLGSLAARLEYERIRVPNTDGLEMLTLGASWTFL